MCQYKIKKRILINSIFVIAMFIISIYSISSFYFTYKIDEEISMGLIQHSFFHLITIDSFDVHPPFYYIFLKLFLILTTFWTKSLFVKTIFARLFSTIFLILFLIYMSKIIKLYKLQVNYKIQIILFLLSPGVINESAKIRMYSLSSFLIVFELYQLLKFLNNKKLINIILLIISASLAFYTIYPLAISTGLFILIYTLCELHKKNLHNSLILIISGVLVLFTYLPWVHIVLKQIDMHSGVDTSLVYNYFYIMISSITQLNAPSPMSPLLKYTSLISLFIIVLFILLIIYSYKNLDYKFNKLLSITIINMVLTLLISVIICKRQFRLTILYPIYSIFISLIIIVAVKYLLSHHENIIFYNVIKSLMVFTVIIFMCYSSVATVVNIKNYDIPSIRFVKIFKGWSHSCSNNIDIDSYIGIKKLNNSHNITGDSVYAIQDAIYLHSLNKNAYIPVNKYNGQKFISGGVSRNKDYYSWKFCNNICFNIKYK